MKQVQSNQGDAAPAVQSLQEFTTLLDDEFMRRICSLGGLSADTDEIKHRLAKIVWRFRLALASGPAKNPDPQRKAFHDLHSSIKRTLKALDAIDDVNQSEIDYQIQYRPPFNNRFYFPQQKDYWNANGDSIQRAENLLKMVSWAAERVSEGIDTELSFGRRTQNSHLDSFIFETANHFEQWSGKPALSQCYFSAGKDGYAGQFFDLVCIVLDTFTDRSYHSKVALGKRIVRLLSLKNR